MKNKIAVIDLGYVGLPLAHAFSEKYDIVGFDIAQWCIDELRSGYDRTLELSEAQAKEAIANGMRFTNVLDDTAECNIYIVTVPTPIDEHKRPDLTPLLKASESIGKVLKKDDIVIYESTVYLGATEEECVPVLEQFSGLKYISSSTPSTINHQPIYRDFRSGDIRHSNANISKAQNFVGYAPTHDICQGMQEAITWYIENIRGE